MSAPPAQPSSKQRSSSSSWPWSGRGCTPARPTRHPRTGARPTCTTKAWSRSPVRVRRGSRSSPPSTSPPRSGSPTDAGRQLIADALELAYRLPRLWKRVLAGEVPVWRARLIARETTDLSVKAALFADRLIAATPRRIGQVKAARLVQEARLYFDPDRALADEEEALTKRGVWLRHGSAPATTDVTMTLDTPDALLFDQTVTRIAGDLKRARRHRGPRGPPRTRGRDPRRPPVRPRPALRTRRGSTQPRRRAGAANLYVHLTPADLAATWTTAPVPPRSRSSAPPPPSCSPTGSPGSRQPAPRSPCAPSSTSTPTAAVDQHDPPEAMRETVVLRDAHCVFPGCRRDSRTCDLDHITEYLPIEDGGPPGQTRPGQSRTSVPSPPPGEDPHRLALQTPRRRQLRVDRAHRAPVPVRARSTLAARPEQG